MRGTVQGGRAALVAAALPPPRAARTKHLGTTTWRGHGRGIHRRVGQRGQRRRRRARDGQLDPDRRRRSTLVRGHPADAAEIADAAVGGLQRRRLRPLGRRRAGQLPRCRSRQCLRTAEQHRAAGQRARLLRHGHRQGGSHPDRRSARRGRSRPRRRLPRQRRGIRQAGRHHRSPRSGRSPGAPRAAVVATEPVAYYLLRNAGVTDRTPPGFASGCRGGRPTRHPPTSPPCST